MKKIFAMIFLLALGGCKAFTIPDAAFNQAEANAVLCDNFNDLMNAGITTREQEQNFIRANRRAWHAQNFALNNEPLPADVEAWETKKRLGLDPSSGAPPTSESRITPGTGFLPR
ncbi:hypothetical protein C4588_06485 [Candidatus Parcubacteria bacterium]|nr:MAG: hypothetical protein C4588_06485 [Candidatus Parcubacteria bacterium]